MRNLVLISAPSRLEPLKHAGLLPAQRESKKLQLWNDMTPTDLQQQRRAEGAPGAEDAYVSRGGCRGGAEPYGAATAPILRHHNNSEYNNSGQPPDGHVGECAHPGAVDYQHEYTHQQTCHVDGGAAYGGADYRGRHVDGGADYRGRHVSAPPELPPPTEPWLASRQAAPLPEGNGQSWHQGEIELQRQHAHGQMWHQYAQPHHPHQMMYEPTHSLPAHHSNPEMAGMPPRHNPEMAHSLAPHPHPEMQPAHSLPPQHNPEVHEPVLPQQEMHEYPTVPTHPHPSLPHPNLPPYRNPEMHEYQPEYQRPAARYYEM